MRPFEARVSTVICNSKVVWSCSCHAMLTSILFLCWFALVSFASTGCWWSLQMRSLSHAPAENIRDAACCRRCATRHRLMFSLVCQLCGRLHCWSHGCNKANSISKGFLMRFFYLMCSRLFGHTGACSACGQSIPASEMVMRAQGNVYHLKVGYVKQCKGIVHPK